MHRSVCAAVAGVGALIAMASVASAQLTVIEQFDVNVGTIVGAGFDQTRGRVWLYDNFGTIVRAYTRGGVNVGSVPRGGEGADDVDISFSTVDLTLNGVLVPAGTLLMINGETGTADIYAIDPGTGAVVASLTTQFGTNHVVGGSYHPGRGTFFLVQDKNGTAGGANRIAEIDPSNGAVLASFGTGSADFTVNYGDIEVNPVSGNLFIVSSDETGVRELTPTGSLVGTHALPAGVTSLSGFGFDAPRGEAWVCSTTGRAFRLGGLGPGSCLGDANADGAVNFADITAILTFFGVDYGDGTGPGDANLGGVVNFADITSVLTNFGNVCVVR